MTIEAAPTVRESLEAAVETTLPVETPAPASEPLIAEAPKEAPAQETETEKADRTAGRLRDEKGRLLPGKAEPAVPAPVVAKVPRPQSWKKELEAEWDLLPPAIQANVVEREKQYQTGVSTYKTEADRAKGVMTALQEFEPALQQAGIPTDKWIQSMGIAHRTLAMGNPQDKLAMVQNILANNRIPAQLAVQDAQGNWTLLGQQQPAQQPQPQFRPEEISTLVQKQVNETLANTRAETEYKAFTEAKSEDGTPKYPHFEAVKGTMAGLLQADLAQDYPSAYEAALAMPKHSDLRPAVQPQVDQVAEKAKAEQAKVGRARSQAVSVKSSTPSVMAPAKGNESLRDTLSAAADKVLASRV